jgi:SAM-dependent methyltransferase
MQSYNSEDDYVSLAKSYWKYVPSGEGKIDTGTLDNLSNHDFLAVWERSKRIRRQNLWEEEHFIAHFAELFAGRKILSFGCGLAYSETEFLDRDSEVTFADIVDSNVNAVRRLCSLREYKKVNFRVLSGDPSENLGGPYDAVFAYGSLMHMPEENQSKVLSQFAKALTQNGYLILMLYTPEFVRSTGSVFDQREFARRSDPSVGTIDNPWSDWHDDAKLERLASDFLVVQKQAFHEDRFIWYGLKKKPTASPFVDLAGLQEIGKCVEQEVDLAAYTEVDAQASFAKGEGLAVVTGHNVYHYAVKFPELNGLQGGALAIEVDISAGGASFGILDVVKDCFVATKSISLTGRRTYYLGLHDLPERLQVVVSNFQPDRPGISRFRILSLRFLINEG